MVIFEVFIIDDRKYLVDVNSRIGGDTIYLFLARYMVLDIGLRYLVIFCKNKYENMRVKELVKKVNDSNVNVDGIIIVLFVVDVVKGCEFYLFIFVKILDEV